MFGEKNFVRLKAEKVLRDGKVSASKVENQFVSFSRCWLAEGLTQLAIMDDPNLSEKKTFTWKEISSHAKSARNEIDHDPIKCGKQLRSPCCSN